MDGSRKRGRVKVDQLTLCGNNSALRRHSIMSWRMKPMNCCPCLSFFFNLHAVNKVLYDDIMWRQHDGRKKIRLIIQLLLWHSMDTSLYGSEPREKTSVRVTVIIIPDQVKRWTHTSQIRVKRTIRVCSYASLCCLVGYIILLENAS